jgi:hypothetical protein
MVGVITIGDQIGYTGSAGNVGYVGSQGTYGGVSLEFLYALDINQTNSDPGAGSIKFNSLATQAATNLNISNTDAATANIGAIITSIDNSTSANKGYIRITKKSDSTYYAIYQINGSVVDNTTWYNVPVLFVAGSAVDFPAQPVLISFERTGDAGTTGYVGSQGSTGTQGEVGFTGSVGAAGYTGSQGLQGPSGEGGLAGNTGYTGSIGYTGSKGDMGFTGPIGYTGSGGYNGSKGDLGYTGSKGDKGDPGDGGAGGATVLERHYKKPGVLTVNPGTEKWYVPLNSTITSMRARVEVAPVGSQGVGVRINVNSNSTATLTINTSTTVSALNTSTVNVNENYFITVDVINIGNINEGSDLTVTFTYIRNI